MLVRKMKLMSLPKGAVLYGENQSSDCMYVILSGTIRLVKKSTALSQTATQESTIAYLNRGDVIGEMSLLVGERNPNTAIVDSTVELLSLQKKDFDTLIEKNPTLAVHLSRMLSTRLATIERTEPQNAPAKIFTLIPAVPTRDQVMFSVNLGLSMVEQTRRKVLLFIVNQTHHVWSKSVGVQPFNITAETVNDGCFEDADRFERLVMVHPSGLELLCVDDTVFFDFVVKNRFPLLELIKDEYDYCFFVLPPKIHEAVTLIMGDSSRISTLLGPHSHPQDIDAVRQITQTVGPNKIFEKIWLTTGSDFFPKDFSPDVRMPWNLDWGKNFLSTGSPFFPPEAKMAHRSMDRLARSYGQLLIGLAMGSGAAFGYSLIGILKVLEREGIYPDVVSGTSMGALIGAFYAAGKTPDELEEIAKTITRARLWRMADFTVPRSGIIQGNGVLNFLRSHLGDKTFKDLRIPFACVATDIMTGKEIVLDEGNVAEAVRASLSLPFFFQPFYLDGRFLVDGGLVNPVPTSIIVSQGANVLLSANLTSKTGDRKVPRVMGWRKRLPPILRGPSIPEIMMKTIYTMQYEIAAARSVLAHVVMAVTAPDMLWWDLDKADAIVKLGEASAEENLSKIKSLLPYFSDSCKVRLIRHQQKHY